MADADGGAGPSPEPRPAPRLGSYLLIEQLGSGGMSNVFRAVHEESGSVVAVKVLPRSLAKNVTLLQRFIREAKSAEALDHPNIVAIYDRGFDQERHYLVLEYVEGRDLHDRVRLNGPLGASEAIAFVRQVAEGLQYAASQGMIHRDVKPANLLMTPTGQAKIIDLGLALQAEDEDERVTRDGTTVGTVDYMAPEQARDSRMTSVRSDIYSLGCTFYYLLTGYPPYPGGGVAEKLARHFKAPIPDICERRPELPEDLSLLIRRMMEKKPDRRFADYDELIGALDALGRPAVKAAPLDALIDEDDEDEGAIGLAPTDPVITPGKSGRGDRPPSTREYLLAEIVEDDRPAPSASFALRTPSIAPEVSLAELAALDADETVASRRQARRPTVAIPVPPKPPVPAVPSIEALLDEDEAVEATGGPVRRGSGGELSLKTWIAAAVMVGLSIALVGFGVSFVISIVKPKPPEVAARESIEAPPEESVPLFPTPPRIKPGPRRPNPLPSTVKADAQVTRPAPEVPSPDRVVARASPAHEVEYPKAWLDRFLPAPMAGDRPPVDRPRIVVRRVIEASDEPQSASLASAFGRLGDIVEIADTGPFFEDDLQVAGKSRLIRARPGLRPIIKVESTSQDLVRDQEAKFSMGGTGCERLVLEGLDLAIDVRDLPIRQSALFLFRGADLTLRDCTITLLNAADRRFSVFRMQDGPRPNRLVLERTTIRGPIRTMVDLTAARAEIVIDRSLVVAESGPLLVAEFADKAIRSLHLIRSLVATRGPLLDFSDRSAPFLVRSLGTTIARVEGGSVSGLIHSRASFPGDPKTVIDWMGEDNDFVGWPAWLTSGPENSIRVAGLDAIPAHWPASDTTSRTSNGSWPGSAVRDEAVPADFVLLAPERRATLDRVAVPHPRLRELTFGSVARLPAPDLSDGLISAQDGGPGPAKPPLIELAFDLQSPPWNGDLGMFLSENVKNAASPVVIRVRGGGVRPMTPVRLPDGLSIAIIGEGTEGSKLAIPQFVPAPGSTTRAMIELRRGDLAVANLAFLADPGSRPRNWIRVEDGLLAIRHCRFRDTGGADAVGSPVIAFVARGSAPIPRRSGPFASATDRPLARLKNSIIWTGGEAITAELGRGIVELDNCLVISGGPAVSLLPQKVARETFEADLVLDRCTIADDRNGIVLGPWLGEPTGPERPWLVSTRSCVFPRTQRDGAGALLLVDADAFARGSMVWQSSADAYEVGRFLASTAPAPSNLPPADVKKQWIDLWGSHHTRNDRGPDPRRSAHVLVYKEKERPRPGKATPQALELDPKGLQKDLGVNFKDLPPPPRN